MAGERDKEVDLLYSSLGLGNKADGKMRNTINKGSIFNDIRFGISNDSSSSLTRDGKSKRLKSY